MDKIKGDNLLKWAGWKWDGPDADTDPDELWFGFWYRSEGDHLSLGEDPDLNSLDLLLAIAETKCKKYTLRKLEGKYTAILGDRQQDDAKSEPSLVLALQGALLEMAESERKLNKANQ